jgi:dGTP triphosphohydrolase
MMSPSTTGPVTGRQRALGPSPAIVDYIAGMTDRYAMDLYKMMFDPYEKIMFEFRD